MRITEQTVARHWHPRYGYCTLTAYPPADTDGLTLYGITKAKRERVRELRRQFWREHGHAPRVVLDGTDAVAMGPVDDV